MRTIIGWLSATVLGSFGWWLGAKIGFGSAMMAGVITGAVGLYLGQRWFDRNLK